MGHTELISPPAAGGLGGIGYEKIPRVSTVGSIKGRMFSRYERDVSHPNSQQLHQHIQDLCESQRGVGLHIFESGHKISPLAEKLLAFESFWGGVCQLLFCCCDQRECKKK